MSVNECHTIAEVKEKIEDQTDLWLCASEFELNHAYSSPCPSALAMELEGGKTLRKYNIDPMKNKVKDNWLRLVLAEVKAEEDSEGGVLGGQVPEQVQEQRTEQQAQPDEGAVGILNILVDSEAEVAVPQENFPTLCT